MSDRAGGDLTMMRRAFELAERGRGFVEPNPLVGAVIVRDGTIVGEGWHQQFGEAHAEVNALNAAGEAARGATLYLSLEPCCHQGKTPPCTDAIRQAGITRVVAAMQDPFPQVNGRGAELLRAAGIEVQLGVGEAEAREQNAPYVKLQSTGRPYIIAKWAMSLDGKAATHTGESRWITGEPARERVHQLRGRVDGIIVGIGTVLADDPLLTARPPGPRTATRIILDSRLRLPLDSQLVRTARQAPVLIAHTPPVDERKRRTLEAAGCKCLLVETHSGRPFLRALLNELGRRQLTNLLVEGGSEVLGSFFQIREVDEVHAFIAPKFMGGKAALSPVGGVGVARMTEAISLQQVVVESIGEDVLIRGRICRKQ
jgi:diaminohydroxyphosphoribosylaminopyrimidine deaminase/5-amino-6-(5-phosphoribosylamino)uracil reductase